MESNQISVICPYCQTPIEESEQKTVCSQCVIPHHAECWLENGGCTTYGCKFTPVSNPSPAAGNAGIRSRTIAPAGLSDGVVCPYCRQTTSNTLPKCEHCQGQLYAGFWNRQWAWTFDKLVLGALSYIFLFILIILGTITAAVAGSGSEPGGIIAIAVLVYYIIMFISSWLYYAITESSSLQASLGKLLFGIAVTDYEGRKITFGRASARYFASILSYLPLFLGFAAAAFTPRKQALHDTITHTVVVRSVKPDSSFKDQNQTRRLVMGIVLGLVITVFTFFLVMVILMSMNFANH